MELSKSDLITILQAISTLESAFMVASPRDATSNFAYWDLVEKAQDSVIKALAYDK